MPSSRAEASPPHSISGESEPTTMNNNEQASHEKGAEQPREAPPVAFGDRQAWLTVLGGFLAFFNVWGVPISYGVYASFYSLDYLAGVSESDIAWIGTVQNFLVSMVSVLSGPIYDLGYYRTLVCVGSFLSVLGIMMLSLSSSYYQLFLSHMCNGVGSGLVYVPTLALVTQRHNKTRSLATGICACGIALGGVCYTVIFLRLQPNIGFPWTVRIMGFVVLFCYAVALPCLIGGPQNVQVKKKARALFDRTAFLNPRWFTYAIAQFASFWGYLIPLFFIPTYAEVVLKSNQATGDWLLVGVQAASLFGRLGAAVAAHYLGVLLPLSFCLVASGVVCLGWLAIDTIPSFAVFCALYGFFSGSLIALPPAVFPLVCPKVSVQGTWMGMAWAITSMASLTGTPIAGSFIDLKTANFKGAQIWSGVIQIIGASLFMVLWLLLRRQQGKNLI